MAVAKAEQSAKLIIKVQTGTNESGNPVYRQRSLANLNPALSDEDVFGIGTALGALQAHTVEAVSRQENAILENA